MLLSEIKLNEQNPRTISDGKFNKLKASIKRFPKMLALRPIVVDAEGVVLGGNMRLRALQALGYKEVPNEWVRVAKDLTDEEREWFVVEDNVEFGEWDFEMLANEYDLDVLKDLGVDIPSMSDDGEEKRREEKRREEKSMFLVAGVSAIGENGDVVLAAELTKETTEKIIGYDQTKRSVFVEDLLKFMENYDV